MFTSLNKMNKIEDDFTLQYFRLTDSKVVKCRALVADQGSARAGQSEVYVSCIRDGLSRFVRRWSSVCPMVHKIW